MYYRCKVCQYEKCVDGCLPGTSCGLLLMVNLGVSLGVVAGVLQEVAKHSSGWVWLAFLPLSVVGFMALTFIPRYIEWLWAMATPCPKCHKRRWSQPFTRGFGL